MESYDFRRLGILQKICTHHFLTFFCNLFLKLVRSLIIIIAWKIVISMKSYSFRTWEVSKSFCKLQLFSKFSVKWETERGSTEESGRQRRVKKWGLWKREKTRSGKSSVMKERERETEREMSTPTEWQSDLWFLLKIVFFFFFLTKTPG